MEISIVFQSIVLIALMIFIGALLSKTFPFNDDTRKMFISLIVNVAMPSIILSSIFKVEMNQDIFKMIIIVFLISILINLTGIGLGSLLVGVFYKDSRKKSEVALLSGLGNTGFIGIPLCAVLLGPEGALFAAIFDAGVDFTIWTVGVFILQKDKKFTLGTLKAMVNIPTAAIVLGLTVAYFNIKAPVLFVQLTDQFATLAAPLAMFYIGVLIMTIQGAKVRQFRFKIWLPTIVKLVFLPLLTGVIIYSMNVEQLIKQTVLIQSMMPTLTLASILFAKYSADEDLGAITIVLSTIVALFTIPMMIYFMDLFI